MMPFVCASKIGELLRPGVQEWANSTDFLLGKAWERYSFSFDQTGGLYTPAAPAIIIPSLPAALAIGAAAAVIKNPVIERRAFIGWVKGLVSG